MRRILEHIFFYVLTSIFAAICTATLFFFSHLIQGGGYNFTIAISTVLMATPLTAAYAFVPYLISLLFIKVIFKKDSDGLYIIFGIICAAAALYLERNGMGDMLFYMPILASGGAAGRFYKYMEYR